MNERHPTLRIAGFPGRYMQGPGALEALPAVAQNLGVRQLCVVSDDTVDHAVGRRVSEQLLAAGLPTRRLRFDGECTASAIENLASQVDSEERVAVVGLGGGKAIDTAKGVAKAVGAPLIVVPTIASNDSPTSRLIVIYDDAHKVVAVEYLSRNPDAVLVDTREIVKAPVRYFRAGIGDALSKKFEAAQCMTAGGLNFHGGMPTETARILAERSYEIILAHGAAAVQAVTRHECTTEVETVIEATVLQSGLGFESGGLSISHAMLRGLTAVPALANALHGEMVVFGTVVQLVLEQRDHAELQRHLQLLSRVGLSATLAALGKATLTAGELDKVATLTHQAPYAKNFDRPLDVAAIKRAIVEADRLGHIAEGYFSPNHLSVERQTKSV